MGRNINLQEMIGAPEHVECPSCEEKVSCWYHDYDIDRDVKDFPMKLDCENCGQTFHIKLSVETKVSIEEKSSIGKTEEAFHREVVRMVNFCGLDVLDPQLVPSDNQVILYTGFYLHKDGKYYQEPEKG